MNKAEKDFGVWSKAHCTILKKEVRNVVETAMNKIVVIMANMDFWAWIYALCTIMKKEVRKLVEKGILNIVILAEMDLGTYI